MGMKGLANGFFVQVNARAAERDVYDGPAGLEKLSLWVQSKL